jgi:hypothetical protein
MKTEALKQALEQHGFDAAGAPAAIRRKAALRSAFSGSAARVIFTPLQAPIPIG